MYSRGSKSELIRISDGRTCSVHGPDHSKSDQNKMGISLDRFKYTEKNICLYKTTYTSRQFILKRSPFCLFRFRMFGTVTIDIGRHLWSRTFEIRTGRNRNKKLVRFRTAFGFPSSVFEPRLYLHDGGVGGVMM